jgi:hypothetical protein
VEVKNKYKFFAALVSAASLALVATAPATAAGKCEVVHVKKYAITLKRGASTNIKLRGFGGEVYKTQRPRFLILYTPSTGKCGWAKY